MCCDHKTCLVWFPIYLAVAHRPFVVVAARPSCARLPVSSPRLFVRSALLGSSRRQTFPFPPSQWSRAVRSSSPLARPAHVRPPSARACSFTRRCSDPFVARPSLFHLPSGRPSSARRRRAPVTRTPARQQPALVRSLATRRHSKKVEKKTLDKKTNTRLAASIYTGRVSAASHATGTGSLRTVGGKKDGFLYVCKRSIKA